MMITPTWNDYFMTMVYLIASRSKDEKTHIGAVIVGPDNEIRSTGYNSFPRGIQDNIPERQERPEKYFWMAHAERNAIYNAARMGISVKGCTLYTNGVPCADCAIAVIQAGITTVVIDEHWDKFTKGKWKNSHERSLQMFAESGVEITYLDFKPIEITYFKDGNPYLSTDEYDLYLEGLTK